METVAVWSGNGGFASLKGESVALSRIRTKSQQVELIVRTFQSIDTAN